MSHRIDRVAGNPGNVHFKDGVLVNGTLMREVSEDGKHWPPHYLPIDIVVNTLNLTVTTLKR